MTFTWSTVKGVLFASADGGAPFLVGKPVDYTDDMPRTGLYQPDNALKGLARSGIYDRQAAAQRVGAWAHFIWPTAMGESGGYFGRVNSYDRAAFTWGCFQMAAHTPDSNLITLFRRLLLLPDATRYFPDLTLRPGQRGKTTVHRLDAAGTAIDLEVARKVVRPNGKTEVQIPDFMAYLNPDPTAVGAEEKRASAALLEWAAASPATRDLQIDHMIATVQSNLRAVVKKVPELVGRPWPQWLWASDIVFQGRAGSTAIRTALAAADPAAELATLGASTYDGRKATVKAKIAVLAAEGVMNAWQPPA